jgi:hypothetical protein
MGFANGGTGGDKGGKYYKRDDYREKTSDPVSGKKDRLKNWDNRPSQKQEPGLAKRLDDLASKKGRPLTHEEISDLRGMYKHRGWRYADKWISGQGPD